MFINKLRPQYLFSSRLPSYVDVDPFTLSSKSPHHAQNYCNGNWLKSKNTQSIIDPLNGDPFITVPDTQISEVDNLFLGENFKNVPISGLHNPLKNPERYQLYGDVIFRIAEEMRKKQIQDYFVKLIQRVVPKHHLQAEGEYVVTRRFFENFGGDQPRFLCRSFNVAGDRTGQQSSGYRFPYGKVALITPFNFPLEIPCLQLFGALMVGNQVFFKGDSRVNVVMEQFLKLALHCGLPKNDIDLVFAGPQTTEHMLKHGHFRNTLFTGSSKVGNHLTNILNGKIRLEDAGFDWKILGPDVPKDEVVQDYVAWQSDQDAYAASGQKCSAQSILFAHEDWVKAGFFERIAKYASKRNLQDLSVGPTITLTNQRIKKHIEDLIKIGGKILFGGKELQNHNIPSIYGSFEPTAIYVPINNILSNKSNFDLATQELFGPFQIVTSYTNIDDVLSIINRLENHLTAGIVSNDLQFLRYVQGNTTNGVTYSGIRARTTGAPQNHWFGPSGDPRGAGIGTPEAILSVWTTHREIIHDTDYPTKFNSQQS